MDNAFVNMMVKHQKKEEVRLSSFTEDEKAVLETISVKELLDAEEGDNCEYIELLESIIEKVRKM